MNPEQSPRPDPPDHQGPAVPRLRAVLPWIAAAMLGYGAGVEFGAHVGVGAVGAWFLLDLALDEHLSRRA